MDGGESPTAQAARQVTGGWSGVFWSMKVTRKGSCQWESGNELEAG